jgi:AraC-like DNA-binding protein
MHTVVRFDDEPVGSRFDYWRHVVGETLVPIDIRPLVPPAEVCGGFLSGEAGAVRVSQHTIDPAQVYRTPKLIRRSDPEMCKIDLVVNGDPIVEQSDQQSRLRPGQFSLIDFSRPGRWVFPATEMIAVMFPRAMLPLRQKELARLTALPFSGDDGIAGLVCSLARQLPRNLDASSTARARLGTAVLDLLTVALARRLDRGSRVPADTRQRALLLRIQAFIEKRLSDPELTPTMIAAAHHVSPRYLYRLFEPTGTTVADWVRTRRLERCRHDLDDPNLSAWSVSAIGARWGFMEPTSFSRAFRAQYGMPPGQYRRTDA